MICELRIIKVQTLFTETCKSLDETISLMIEEFSKADECNLDESTKLLVGVTEIIAGLPENQEFVAWEIEDHDKDNEITKCIIKKISN
jgi:hypothetical protein